MDILTKEQYTIMLVLHAQESQQLKILSTQNSGELITKSM